tara:strand:- start:76 stop:357 length:282 start_codon:yes stop_codon:yes gene_type:complete
MDTVSLTRFGFSFLFVIGLILVLAWAVRRFGLEKKFQAGERAGKRLCIQESLMIDPRRRLVLIKRDEKEHLLLLGTNTEQVLESYDTGEKEHA